MNRFANTFRALENPNFRLFYIGQGISLVGTWMQQLAMSWLVYRLTGSALMLGVIGFAGQIPALVLVPVAGMLADRFDRRAILVLTQGLAMLQAFAVALLVLSGLVESWHLVALAAALGCVNAFDMPTRQSFVIEMIDRKEDLPNAIALNSSLFNAARLAGPMVAGALIVVIGEGMCFLLNGVSYMAVIASLVVIRVPAKPVRETPENPLAALIAGVRYTFGFGPIRALLLLIALMSLAGMSFTVLLPVFAKSILGGDSGTLGVLSGATGFGALAGALYLASRADVRGLGRVIALSSAVFGGALCLLSVSRTTALSAAALALAGFGMIAMMASGNTILQTIVDDSMRGRVMSFYTMAFAGMVPFGSLASGAAAERIGTPLAVAAGGVLCIAGALVFACYLPRMRAMVRPIYVRKGIIPEMAQAMHSADAVTSMQEE
ncbi:MAG: MFS transporter [Spirochaetes bacterium]|nr:MAG: MFS transporter [Spirochaetota bacterium]